MENLQNHKNSNEQDIKKGFREESDMEEFDRTASEMGENVATPEEGACYRDRHKVVQPNQGDGSNTVKTEEHT